MKKIRKSTFFIVVALITLFCVSSVIGLDYIYGDNTTTIIKGVDDIRLGIDIKGGVDVTFAPADGSDATSEQLNAAAAIIDTRLATLGITDSEVYSDEQSDRIIVRFPWQAGESDFDPSESVKELGEMATLTFREGTDYEVDDDGNIIPTGEIILEGSDIASATAVYRANDSSGEYQNLVELQLNDSGREKFAEATSELAGTGTAISIWMDNTMISAPTVSSAITDGSAVISGSFTDESANKLANQINSGSLPFKLETTSFKTIDPTMGEGSLNAILIAALIAFIFIAIYMISLYRLPGVVAIIALCGQIGGSIAVVSGWFGFMSGTTLTIPGIAGIILSVGMGVDANIITGERIKEELQSGKSLDSAIRVAYKRAFTSILDGNITNVIIAIILMGAFGVPDSFFSKILNNTIFFLFGATAEGTVYSFGVTLLAGVVLNFIMGVFFARIMVTSLSKFKCFQNKKLYGYKENVKESKKFDFCSKKKMVLGVLIGVLVLFAGGIAIRGTNFALEFSGGTMITYDYTGEIDSNEVANVVKEIVNVPVSVRKGENMDSDGKQITISFTSEDGLNVDRQVEMTNALNENFPDNSLELFDSTDVSPSSGREFLLKCLVAVIFAAIVVIIYIAIRFKKIGGLSAGVCSVLALLHDIIVALVVSILLGFEINSNTVAVILTILGYSINNTIVIYDRIRENKKLMPKATLNELINAGCSQSMTRSIRTSITTISTMLIVTIVVAISGYTSLLTFSVPLMFGLISGAYSSIFVAPITWSWWKSRKTKN